MALHLNRGLSLEDLICRPVEEELRHEEVQRGGAIKRGKETKASRLFSHGILVEIGSNADGMIVRLKKH